jgi:hypothetical protein
VRELLTPVLTRELNKHTARVIDFDGEFHGRAGR